MLPLLFSRPRRHLLPPAPRGPAPSPAAPPPTQGPHDLHRPLLRPYIGTPSASPPVLDATGAHKGASHARRCPLLLRPRTNNLPHRARDPASPPAPVAPASTPASPPRAPVALSSRVPSPPPPLFVPRSGEVTAGSDSGGPSPSELTSIAGHPPSRRSSVAAALLLHRSPSPAGGHAQARVDPVGVDPIRQQPHATHRSSPSGLVRLLAAAFERHRCIFVGNLPSTPGCPQATHRKRQVPRRSSKSLGSTSSMTLLYNYVTETGKTD